MSTRRITRVGRAVSAVILAIGITTFAGSLAWRDAAFPGFFVMPNRVVPSVGLPGWSGTADGRPLYQQVVLAVDGTAITRAEDVYRVASRHQTGDEVRYTVARGGELEQRSFPLLTFGRGTYLVIFGMYLLTGLSYLSLAVLAGERRAEHPALAGGLAAFGWASAAFSLTALDLYGPGRLFRLHAFAEAMLPAALLHLALVCPRDRISSRPGLLTLVYGGGAALAAVYQLFLYEPAAYTILHDACQALMALPGLALAVMLGLAAGEPAPALGARNVRRLFTGALVGIVTPAVVLGASGASGGLIPVNASAWVAFAFPLAAGLALRGGADEPAGTPLPVQREIFDGAVRG